MTIQGKSIVITGASSGIGEAAARLLAQKGAKLTLGARRGERLERIVSEINKGVGEVGGGGEAGYIVTDVVKKEDNIKLIKFAKEKYGKIDAFVLNAGVMPNSPMSKLLTDDWDWIVDVNLTGVLRGIEAALPEFIAQKRGHFIALSSVAGLKVYPGGAVYCASKWAVKALMETLRMESAMEKTNIRTTTIYPAAIDTELLKTISDKDSKKAYDALYETYAIKPLCIAEIIAFAIDQPESVCVNEFTVGPAAQPW
jgi:NADP-dependent 3-hydroxy acid dehydrogenase YdfG